MLATCSVPFIRVGDGCEVGSEGQKANKGQCPRARRGRYQAVAGCRLGFDSCCLTALDVAPEGGMTDRRGVCARWMREEVMVVWMAVETNGL